MALKYAEWLKASGKAATETNAMLWKQTHGKALGLYDAAGNPVHQPVTGTTQPGSQYPTPTYTPGALDAQASAEVADLERWKSLTAAAAERDYQQGIAQINASRAMADYEREQGLNSVDDNTGARGLSRSGIRQEGRGRVETARSQQENQFGLAAQAAANAKRTAVDTAEATYQTGRTGTLGAFGQRDYGNWMANNPVLAPGPGAAATSTEVPGAPRTGSRTQPGTTPAAKRNLTFQQFADLHKGIKQDSVMQAQYKKYKTGGS